MLQLWYSTTVILHRLTVLAFLDWCSELRFRYGFQFLDFALAFLTFDCLRSSLCFNWLQGGSLDFSSSGSGGYTSIDSHRYLDSTTSPVFTFHCSGWMSFIRIRRKQRWFSIGEVLHTSSNSIGSDEQISGAGYQRHFCVGCNEDFRIQPRQFPPVSSRLSCERAPAILPVLVELRIC